MAKELDAILDHGEANPAGSCKTESGSVSFLERVIRPIYDTLKAVRGYLSTVSIILNPNIAFSLSVTDKNKV